MGETPPPTHTLGDYITDKILSDWDSAASGSQSPSRRRRTPPTPQAPPTPAGPQSPRSIQLTGDWSPKAGTHKPR